MIRIISGIYKGRRLKLVPSTSVRPMQDKVKGALFNIIGDRRPRQPLPGRLRRDGLGRPRGPEPRRRDAASSSTSSTPSIKVIKQNVAKCGADEKAVVLHREFNRAVIDLAKQGVRFDLIFLDPPYRLLEERNPLKVIRKRGLLKPGGLIVLRHYFKIKPKLGDFKLERRVALGDDILLLFSPLAAEAGPARPGAAGPRPAGPSKPRLPAKPRSLKMRVMKKAGGSGSVLERRAPRRRERDLLRAPRQAGQLPLPRPLLPQRGPGRPQQEGLPQGGPQALPLAARLRARFVRVPAPEAPDLLPRAGAREPHRRRQGQGVRVRAPGDRAGPAGPAAAEGPGLRVADAPEPPGQAGRAVLAPSRARPGPG